MKASAPFQTAVEQLMQRYYRTVMDLSRLNEMLLQLFQEAILLNPDAEPEALSDDFEVKNGFLQVAHEKCKTAFRKHRPGTTVAALHAHGNYCFALWAGDSRIYRLRNGALEQLTRDHSQAQERYDRGELTEEELASHHSAHVLTRSVGAHKNLRLDMSYMPVEAGDRYLLCSDGLYNPAGFDEIRTALAQGSAEDACRALVDLALEGGGRDNITVIIVDARQPD